jgi:hypothetical protein
MQSTRLQHASKGHASVLIEGMSRGGLTLYSKRSSVPDANQKGKRLLKKEANSIV